jgi:hypothetical protein
MKGKDVETAQRLLSHNVFNQDYLQGEVDGQFGPESARGCKRAKYWLGWTDDKLGTYGEPLHLQLQGKRELTKAQKARRAARLKKAKETPLRVKALVEARKDVGMKESPAGSNICPISKWYRLTGPWCAMAVTYWYVQAGSKGFQRSQRWAYCPYILQAAIRGDHGLSLTRNPKQGDIVLFDWDNDRIADHVGILRSDGVDSNGNFKTIEGNTSTSNNSNGGECMNRDRHISDVVSYSGRPVFIHAAK